eukprot:26219-Eustigmatos_ZCMA.PRE.1
MCTQPEQREYFSSLDGDTPPPGIQVRAMDNLIKNKFEHHASIAFSCSVLRVSNPSLMWCTHVVYVCVSVGVCAYGCACAGACESLSVGDIMYV